MSSVGYAILFLKAFLLTIAVEAPIAWLLLSRHLRRAGEKSNTGMIIAAALLGNMATLPYLWFFYPLLFGAHAQIVFGETTAVAVEGVVYFLMTDASLGASFAASLAANTASVITGLLVMPPFKW